MVPKIKDLYSSNDGPPGSGAGVNTGVPCPAELLLPRGSAIRSFTALRAVVPV